MSAIDRSEPGYGSTAAVRAEASHPEAPDAIGYAPRLSPQGVIVALDVFTDTARAAAARLSHAIGQSAPMGAWLGGNEVRRALADAWSAARVLGLPEGSPATRTLREVEEIAGALLECVPSQRPSHPELALTESRLALHLAARTGGGQGPAKKRRVCFEWLGARCPGLWNWLQVREPASATPEEIAVALWLSPRCTNRLTVTGSYVCVTPEWAELLPQAAAYRYATNRGADAPGDDAAPEATGDQRTAARGRLIATLEATAALLTRLYGQLDRWALHGGISPGLAFVREMRPRLRAAPLAQLADWEPAISDQYQLVARAAAAIGEILGGESERASSAGPCAVLTGPVMAVVRAFAHAAGTAHVGELAHTTLTHARAAHFALLGATDSTPDPIAMPHQERT